jgi:hypothetical protein
VTRAPCGALRVPGSPPPQISCPAGPLRTGRAAGWAPGSRDSRGAPCGFLEHSGVSFSLGGGTGGSRHGAQAGLESAILLFPGSQAGHHSGWRFCDIAIPGLVECAVSASTGGLRGSTITHVTVLDHGNAWVPGRSRCLRALQAEVKTLCLSCARADCLLVKHSSSWSHVM